MQCFNVSVAILGRPRVCFLLAVSFQHQQHRHQEFVRLELFLHAPRQTVIVTLVAKIGLDLPDIRIGPAHERLNEEFPARCVRLIPKIGPVTFRLPAAKTRHEAGLAEVACRRGLHLFGDVYTLAPDLDNLFVGILKSEQLVMSQVWEYFDQGSRINFLSIQSLRYTLRITFRIVELDPFLRFCIRFSPSRGFRLIGSQR